MFAWVRYATEKHAAGPDAMFDIDLCDALGNICVKMNGFAARAVAGDLGESRTGKEEDKGERILRSNEPSLEGPKVRHLPRIAPPANLNDFGVAGPSRRLVGEDCLTWSFKRWFVASENPFPLSSSFPSCFLPNRRLQHGQQTHSFLRIYFLGITEIDVEHSIRARRVLLCCVSDPCKHLMVQGDTTRKVFRANGAESAS